jgi:cytochrome c oxidase cbb3-type subunit 3
MLLRSFLLLCCVLLIAPAFGAPDGAVLFSRNCAACHGLDGNGGVGVPLALPAFLDSVPNDYLRKTIRNGRPGRVMPAFTQLSDAQVNAIIGYIRHWSKGKPPRLSTKPIHGDVAHGAKLFASHCAVCHGKTGEGGQGTGVTFSRPRNLPIMPPALRNRGFLAAASDQMIKATLMNGRAGTPMVSFRKEGLSEKDIDDLVAYVRSFQNHLPKDRSAQQARDDKHPVLVYDSPYGLEETVKNVKQAAVARQFRIIRVQYFNQGLVPKGKEDTKRIIVYFCNFNMLNQALAIDPRVGLFLPCRVTVVEHAGKVRVMSINPESLSHLFNNQELDRICGQMQQLYKGILEEATL